MFIVILRFSQICSSVITAQQLWKKWNLLSTHEQKHTMESIYNEVYEIHKCFPLGRGYPEITLNITWYMCPMISVTI